MSILQAVYYFRAHMYQRHEYNVPKSLYYCGMQSIQIIETQRSGSKYAAFNDEPT